MYQSRAFTLLVLCLSVPCLAQSADEEANAFFDSYFNQDVSRYPVRLTFMGRAERKDEWNDLSEAFADESLSIAKSALSKLRKIDQTALTEETALSYDLLLKQLEQTIEDDRWRLHNYPVHQMRGVHSQVPAMLISQHRVKSIKDAQSYVTRLEGVDEYFTQLIDALKLRAEAGIVPPRFVFAHVIRDSNNIITGAPFDNGSPSTLLADFVKKLDALAARDGIDLPPAARDALYEKAVTALQDSVGPAYRKLIAYLSQLEKSATTDAGVWKWPNGPEFYEVALNRMTTTDLSASQIHEIGLKEVARIHEEMRKIKKQVGFEGDLREFMQFMREDKQFYYPGTDAGRARYLEEATAFVKEMNGKLGQMFITLPKTEVEVKRVEPFREQSAGKAFYSRPSEDGSRPGVYWTNLYDMNMMPNYQMEALAYHEGVPGHHMQIAIQQELVDVPLFRKFSGYTAFSEGWGLYSEYLPKEFGAYENPYSDFGRLATELWRAARMVVDTGIHVKKWTRERGIDYYYNNTPNAHYDAVKMVERHIVMPAQATAYKVGMLKILELREYARSQLGDAFDIREFHEEVLRRGPLPMYSLEKQIVGWIAQKKAA